MDLYAQAEQILLVDEAVVAPLTGTTDDHSDSPGNSDMKSITGYDHWEKWIYQR